MENFVLLLAMMAANGFDAVGYSFKHKQLNGSGNVSMYGKMSKAGRVISLVFSFLMLPLLVYSTMNSCDITVLPALDFSLLCLVGVCSSLLFDHIGYTYREKMFVAGGNTGFNSMISHSAQSASLVSSMFIILPYMLLSNDVTVSMLVYCSYVLCSFAMIRFSLYNMIYNAIQGTGLYYESKSSFAGKITLWFYGVVGEDNKRFVDDGILTIRVCALFLPIIYLLAVHC